MAMRVIAKHPRLSDFWREHPQAEKPLLAWHREVEHSAWANFADLRATYGSADKVGRYVVFNVGGNKYRLVCHVRFDIGIVFVKAVLTHEEYDEGDWKDD